ncbi:MAG: alpha/beta hydrolase [Pleurocapsa sp.]
MNIQQNLKLTLVLRCLITLSLGLSVLAFKSKSAWGAEQVKLIYGPFQGKISVESLARYAATGEMSREFRLYSKFVDEQTLVQLRYWLNNRFECDRVAIHQFSHTPEGKQFLQQLGSVIKTHPQHNGFYAVRSALLKAADLPNDSDGWTVIEAMQQFPTEDLQIDTKDLFDLQQFWSDDQSSYRAAVKIFAPQAKP